jgi:hypothetical protein
LGALHSLFSGKTHPVLNKGVASAIAEAIFLLDDDGKSRNLRGATLGFE